MPKTSAKSRDFKAKNQVVETEQAQKTQSVAPNAYLGAQNQIVDRESVSSKHVTVMGKSQNLARTENETKRKAVRHSNQTRHAVPALPALGNLGVPMVSKQPELETDQQRANNENWAAQGGSSPQDYVKGVRESNRTLLNTKEFVFYGYYQRIRERLDSQWVPVLREKLIKYYNSGRQLASDMDHSTRVLVVLNRQGDVTAVKIVSESGTQELDDAAVQAFNQAGPFPNPPKGIVGANGLIEIPWEFILRT